MRDHFAWEYKGKKKNLNAAYLQLCQYREDLGNPPLLVVCDTDRFEIHTNFTATVKKIYSFRLQDLRDGSSVRVLENLFREPQKLRPSDTPESVTIDAAARIAQIAISLERRGISPERAAHFLVQIVFCFFAEDVGLLPNRLFRHILTVSERRKEHFERFTRELFVALKDGGYIGFEEVPWFNGGLFANDAIVDLSEEELHRLRDAAKLDWSTVEPATFGTLFERSLDPGKRQQLGAHYTSPEDIQAILEPVIFKPLRDEWESVKHKADQLLLKREGTKGVRAFASLSKLIDAAVGLFLDRLRSVTVLDPACGSGNFLYLALKGLKNFEGDVIAYTTEHNLTQQLPFVSPQQLFGIEVNQYAHELAQVVVWIGHIQWAYHNSYQSKEEPILRAFDNIKHADAILCKEEAREYEWPDATFIVGNPPFLGGKLLRSVLGDDYVNTLFHVYKGRVSREADLVCYWFEKARSQIQAGSAERAGLVATNSIRGGPNRRVIDKITNDVGVFMAWSDRPWVLEGASVRVSMLGFGGTKGGALMLDGKVVSHINSDLTDEIDLTTAFRLAENAGISFMADTKGGPFEIPNDIAQLMLTAVNPDGRSNDSVVRPWVNGIDIMRHRRNMWIIDFGVDMAIEEAALFEAPFEHIERVVRPVRSSNNRPQYREKWWIHAEPRPAMRKSLSLLSRYIATPALAKHRLFVFLGKETLPDHQLIVFAWDDWFRLGVLQSKVHVSWALRKGTSLEDRPRYTSTTTFETFPFPQCDERAKDAIGVAAEKLYRLREGAVQAEQTRTLTGLYNEQPTWLKQHHAALDEAVTSAYGWSVEITEDEIARQLLIINQGRPRT